LTYHFSAFATETRNTEHILEITPINYKSLFCRNERKIKSVKHPMKLVVTNRRQKSIQKHKRNIQCQWISGSHWEDFALLYFSIKYCFTLLPSKFL